MQRQILHGVPYFTDSQNRLYIWDTETPTVCVGSYDPESDSVSLDNTAIAQLESRLQSWRTKQHPRPRKSTATTSKRRGNSNDAPPESADPADSE